MEAIFPQHDPVHMLNIVSVVTMPLLIDELTKADDNHCLHSIVEAVGTGNAASIVTVCYCSVQSMKIEDIEIAVVIEIAIDESDCRYHLQKRFRLVVTQHVECNDQRKQLILEVGLKAELRTFAAAYSPIALSIRVVVQYLWLPSRDRHCCGAHVRLHYTAASESRLLAVWTWRQLP